MRVAALGALVLLLQGGFDRGSEVDAVPGRFHYERALQIPANASGQMCAVLDAAVFEHTEGRLSALRVYKMSGGAIAGEQPFAFTESGEAGQQEEAARVLNLGMANAPLFAGSEPRVHRGSTKIVFDLAMPQRAYSAVVLDLNARDFYATAKVWGQERVGAPRTLLGQFALFDLRAQGLSRSTTLALAETNLPLLHVELEMIAAPGGDASTLMAEIVRGASVPPSRQAQTLYSTVAQTSAFEVKDRKSIAKLMVAAHVPVERVRFAVAKDFAKNFSREVTVTAKPVVAEKKGLGAERDTSQAETVTGEIHSVKMPVNALGEEIHDEQMNVEAVLGANLRSAATVEVAVANFDDAPLPLATVELQMRQRKLCFDAEAGTSYVLRYGDSEPVRAPVYDYARLFRAEQGAAMVVMGAEKALQVTAAVVESRSYMDTHPEVLWVVLLVVVGVLGMVAVRGSRNRV